LYGHFGSAPYFAFADTESGFVHIKANGGRHHQRGQCAPIDYVDVGRTDAVVCQGMGKRALASLERGGVAVLAVDEACGGYGHGHRH